MTTFVIKNDGRKEPYNVDKIKACIQHATRDLDVNPLALESKFNKVIHDGMSTDDIQANLIEHAKQMCSPTDTDWSFVAGRFETMRRWKKCHVFERTFYYYLKEQIDAGIYKHEGFTCWTKAEINRLSQEIDHNRDLYHGYGSVITGNKKYLMKGETIQHMHMANAMVIASVESKEERLGFAIEVYHALSKRKISLATPWLSNLRAGHNISSCFIIGVNDDLESISRAWTNAAMISKFGGGLGIDLGLIRASKATINGLPESSKGIVPWAKIFNDIAVAVDQGGKRAGAFTIHVPIWHRDIEDFLEVQSENKDPRRQCFDIFPQLGIYDLFMQEQNKEDGGTWYTFCPYEVETVMGFKLTGIFGKEFNQRYRRCIRAYESGKLKNVGVYNAKSLVKIAMKTQFESGLPYLAFLDTINEANPNDHEGYIPCVNLCTESFSNVVADKYAHTCNLASVVAGRIESFEELDYITRLTTRILDNGIALTNSPIPESNAHNERYRTIGIGIQGMHDWLAINNLGYDNIKELSEFVERLQYAAVSASVDLAEKRGAYPAFKGSQWDTGKIIDKYKKNSVTDLDYDALQKKMNKVGIRNSQLTSPAPNTSTAPFMDASAGFMPVYRAFFNEDNSTGKFPVFGMHLKQNPLAYEHTQPRMNQAKLTKAVGAAQKWIDTGVSAEYVFDMNTEGFSAKDLYELWNSAWKNRTKAVYYIRSIKKGKTIDSIMSGESVCAGCTG